MTSLAEEAAEQHRWIAQARGNLDVYHALVANEFDSEGGHRERTALPLKRVLSLASQQVPHYRDLMHQRGLLPEESDPFELLEALPVLTRNDLHALGNRLHAGEPPEARDRVANVVQFVDAAGRTTLIPHSFISTRIHGVLKQREYRWFRCDPMATLASIRPAAELPRQPDGSLLPVGQVLQETAWPYMADVFVTGPHVCFNVTNPVGRQHEFLTRLGPRCLQADPQTLAQLATAASPKNTLAGLIALSRPMSEELRDQIRRSFGVPVHQTYASRELGRIALRCEAGLFHVHNENCHVEILDDAARPVASAGVGRLVVTTLTNTAMPLIRFDTGDRARAAQGHCACGRTMPSFADVVAG